MSGKAFGLNIMKKPALASRQPPPKRKTIFDDDDDDDDVVDSNSNTINVESINEFDDSISVSAPSKPKPKSKSKLPAPPKTAIASKPVGPPSRKLETNTYNDLSTNFSSKKYAETAQDLDANIYDYDAVYDSMKPTKVETEADVQRKPKYMSNLLAAAAVRKRDATIAEEKKYARERENEGEEFADKEKFVTSAYKKQQEENRRLEAEEKVREEEEARRNAKTGGGMVGFMRNVLDKGEKRHAEIMKAAEQRTMVGAVIDEDGDKFDELTYTDLAKKINAERAGTIALDDEGQVVDKRQLLKGGLNILPKAKSAAASKATKSPSTADHTKSSFVGAGGSKQAMRERQTRMLEAQLEQATKRSLEADAEEQERVERAAKSQKTEGEIMGAKERYLARKREAEEAKKKAETS